MTQVSIRLGLLVSLCMAAEAAVIVAPGANEAAEGNDRTIAVTRNLLNTFQWVFDDSQLAGIAPGSRITGIGFRLNGEEATGPAADAVYPRWDLQLSSSLNGAGSLSDTFADNIGADVVTVRSGALTIPAGALTGGAGPNPFYFIPFTTTYTYTGGDLLMTLRSQPEAGIFMDAVTFASAAGIADTVGAIPPSDVATTGLPQFFSVPVTAFQYEPVPEPASFMLFAGGAIAVLAVRAVKAG